MKLISLISILIGLVLTMIGSLVPVQAQDFQFSLPKVTQNNQIKDTEKINNQTIFNDTLSLNDNLKFAWSNIDLNLLSKSNPTPTTGYIKAYITEIKDENLILDFDSSPLQIDKISQKLKEGKNNLIFVLYSNNTKTDKIINFTFNFKFSTLNPVIKILKPSQNSIFSKNSKHNIVLSVENMIVKSGIQLPNHGKIVIYYDKIEESNFITQITDSEVINSLSNITINSDALGDKFKNLKDSTKTKLLFVPITNDNKTITTSQVNLEVTTNFFETLDIKTPLIEFVNISPTNNVIKNSDNIKFKISNFKILKYDTRNSIVNNEGYLQILVNDKPHKLTFDRQEFTINELVPNYKEEKINIKLQLVNADFTQLNPVVNTSLDLFIKQQDLGDITNNIQASNWRLAIILVTIILILGSVIYIVFRT
jgi:hypothetical protein